MLAVGAAGQANTDKVAGPIGESLIGQRWAWPWRVGGAGYNAPAHRNDGVPQELKSFAYDLNAYLVTDARVRDGSPAKVVPIKKSEPGRT